MISLLRQSIDGWGDVEVDEQEMYVVLGLSCWLAGRDR